MIHLASFMECHFLLALVFMLFQILFFFSLFWPVSLNPIGWAFSQPTLMWVQTS